MPESDPDKCVIRPDFLSATDRRELVGCVHSQREDHCVAGRANAILLLDDGKSCQAIAGFLYLDDDTIRGWFKTCQTGGRDALSTDGWKGGHSRMTSAQETELCAWVRAGSKPAVQTTAGRGRVNIHGALNLETFDAPFVEPTTVDGRSAAQLLARIEARNPDKRLIHVIRDNAACHKGPDVREFLARPDCRIHLIQLPPYCPHLNPASQRTHAFACRPMIERLWAVMHQYVTYNRHYPTQTQFANAILTFFRETIPNEWKTFRSQVSDNFRVVTHQEFRVLG